MRPLTMLQAVVAALGQPYLVARGRTRFVHYCPFVELAVIRYLGRSQRIPSEAVVVAVPISPKFFKELVMRGLIERDVNIIAYMGTIREANSIFDA